jgi:hypothetical protein
VGWWENKKYHLDELWWAESSHAYLLCLRHIGAPKLCQRSRCHALDCHGAYASTLMVYSEVSGGEARRGRDVHAGYHGRRWPSLSTWAAWASETKIFNLALLAQHTWRILQETSSLSARVLKAAYFLNTDFLEAELSSAPSRIWRAVLDGKEVLKQGLIQRIGTGEDTNVW